MTNYLPNTELLSLGVVSILLVLTIIISIVRDIKYRRAKSLAEINHQAKILIQEEALRAAEKQIKAAKDAIEIFQKGFRVYNQKSKKLKIELEALQEKNRQLANELEKMEKDNMLICQSADRLILKMMKEMYQEKPVIPKNLEKIVQKKQIPTLNN